MHYFSPCSKVVTVKESLVAAEKYIILYSTLPSKEIPCKVRNKISGWLLTVIKPNYVLKSCYIFEGEKYDPSSKIAGSGYDVVIWLTGNPLHPCTL